MHDCTNRFSRLQRATLEISNRQSCFSKGPYKQLSRMGRVRGELIPEVSRGFFVFSPNSKRLLNGCFNFLIPSKFHGEAVTVPLPFLVEKKQFGCQVEK